MKKKLAAILILLIGAQVTARGYRGTRWKEKLTDFLQDKQTIEARSENKYKIRAEEARMMSQDSWVYYYFNYGELIAIGYEIQYDEKTEARLIDNLSEFPYKIIIDKPACEKPLYESLKGQLEFSLTKTVEDVYYYENGGDTMTDYFIRNNEPGSIGRFVQAQLDDDTDVFIFSNIFTDTIIVIYTEKYIEEF